MISHGIIVPYLQVDYGSVMLHYMTQSAFCQLAGNTPSPMIGVNSHIGNEIRIDAAPADKDERQVTNHFPISSQTYREWVGRGFR